MKSGNETARFFWYDKNKDCLQEVVIIVSEEEFIAACMCVPLKICETLYNFHREVVGTVETWSENGEELKQLHFEGLRILEKIVDLQKQKVAALV